MDPSPRLVLCLGLGLAAAVAVLAWLVPGRSRGGILERAEGGSTRGAVLVAPGRGEREARSAGAPRIVELAAAGTDAPARVASPLTARAAERDEAPVQLETPLPGAALSLAEWRGRVRAAPTLRPVTGARVVLLHEARVADAVTDADGAFALAWPSGLAADLVIEHPGYADLRVAEADLARDGLFHLEPSGELEGVVRPWPPPGLAEGAEVRALLWPRDPRLRPVDGRRTALLDGEGAFAFLDVPAGAWNLAVHAPGALVDERGDVAIGPGQRVEVELRARRAGVLVGRVVDSGERTPVAGARITASALRRSVPREDETDFAREARTDENGAFRLTGLAPGPHRLVLHLPWDADVRRDVAVPESLAPEDVEIVVPPPVRLAGRVVDADGTPVAGAGIAILRSSLRGDFDRALRERRGDGAPHVTTDATGAFVVERAPSAERLTVLALPADPTRFSASVQVGPLRAGEVAPELLVRLPRGVALEGRVLGTDGSPAEHATVTLRAVHGSASETAAEAPVDEHGFFRFDAAPAGVVVLTAEAPAYLAAAGRLELGPDGARDVRFALLPAFRVEGRVVAEDGGGVSGLAVRLELEAEGSKGRWPATSDPFGRLSYDRLARGRWIPRLSSADWEIERSEPAWVDVPESAAFVLRVRPTARSSLAAVRGEAWTRDGAPLVGLRVRGLGHGAVLTTDGERFEARGVEPGQRTLHVEAQGYVPVRLARLALEPGAVQDVGRLELEPGTRLVVRVTDARGAPLRGARVALRPIPRDRGGAGGGAWRLEPRGRGDYRAPAVPRGRWRLRVTRDGFRVHDETIEVREGLSQVVRVRLRPE